jgi:hypothetical protein
MVYQGVKGGPRCRKGGKGCKKCSWVADGVFGGRWCTLGVLWVYFGCTLQSQ